jgi:membrane protein required for colicin V production
MPQIFAFIIIFVVVFLVVSIGGRILSKVIHFTPLGIIDRILGGVLGLIKGLVICFVLLVVVMLIRKDTRVLSESQIAKQIASSGIEASKLLPRSWYEWIEETFKRSDIVLWNENDHFYF